MQVEMCAADKSCRKIHQNPSFWGSRSSMLRNLQSPSPVFVMISSMSVPTCNCFRTTSTTTTTTTTTWSPVGDQPRVRARCPYLSSVWPAPPRLAHPCPSSGCPRMLPWIFPVLCDRGWALIALEVVHWVLGGGCSGLQAVVFWRQLCCWHEGGLHIEPRWECGWTSECWGPYAAFWCMFRPVSAQWPLWVPRLHIRIRGWTRQSLWRSELSVLCLG